ncbi:uncharacterized protein PADG_03159 [Paracoccidioides brasiliensis Pb18]|uniref:Uncharacterized protein n=1 Tax=Paracoccidioides brasiliensis (strain Pb18) TaxID=502780 RepID=C1G7K4_PARBD|nr:uncharacterized protein PADG_03159 [Paracoccidioides brasiliensis Pb18]EEH47061.1 hypothetical protein PADG_03159 [Paracoccidioides brasiliensis Pb18]
MHPPFAESLEFAGKQLDIRLREEQQATGLCAFVYALQSGGKRESLMISVTSLSPGHRSVHSRGLAKSDVSVFHMASERSSYFPQTRDFGDSRRLKDEACLMKSQYKFDTQQNLSQEERALGGLAGFSNLLPMLQSLPR